MLTGNERNQHFQRCVAPIDRKFYEGIMRQLRKVKEGELIWITTEGFEEEPVKFVKLEEGPKFNRVHYLYEFEGEEYPDDCYPYVFIRKVEDAEKIELRTRLLQKLKFYK